MAKKKNKKASKKKTKKSSAKKMKKKIAKKVAVKKKNRLSLKSRVQNVRKKLSARKVSLGAKLKVAQNEIKSGIGEVSAKVQDTVQTIGITSSRVQERGIEPLVSELVETADDLASDLVIDAREIAAAAAESVSDKIDEWRGE